MPLIRFSLRAGKDAAYLQALVDGVQRALVRCFDIPINDRFAVLDEYDANQMVFPQRFLGRDYSPDLVLIAITASPGRSSAQKNALYSLIAANLSANPGVVKDDIVINIVETDPENWSFGGGVPLYPALAQARFNN